MTRRCITIELPVDKVLPLGDLLAEAWPRERGWHGPMVGNRLGDQVPVLEAQALRVCFQAFVGRVIWCKRIELALDRSPFG